MTNEMLRIILRLALTNLLALPSATLHALPPWVRREHIRFCLDHTEELRLEDAEDVEVRQWLQEAAQLLKQERAVPQPYVVPTEAVAVLEMTQAFLARLDASQVLPFDTTQEALALRRHIEDTLAKHVYQGESP